ncbi:hypothetical protein Tco_0699358 [Tanacetum coccineum]
MKIIIMEVVKLLDMEKSKVECFSNCHKWDILPENSRAPRNGAGLIGVTWQEMNPSKRCSSWHSQISE